MRKCKLSVVLSGLALLLVLAYAPSRVHAEDPCYELTAGNSCEDLLGSHEQYANLGQLCSGCSEVNKCVQRNQVEVADELVWDINGLLSSPDATPDGENTAQSYIDGKRYCVLRMTCPEFCHNPGGGMICQNLAATLNEEGSEWVEDDALTGPPCTPL